MKKFFAVLAVFFLCFSTAFADFGGGLSPASAASQTEVNAGTIGNKYVSPLTLAGSNGGTNNVTKTGNSTISGIVTATNTGNSFSGTFSGTFPTNLITTNELDTTYFLINTTNQIVASNFTPFTNGPVFQVNGVYTWNSGFSWKSLAGNTLTGAYTNSGLNVFFGADPDNSGTWIVSLSSRSLTGYTNGYYYNAYGSNLTGAEWDYMTISGRVDGTPVTGALVSYQGLIISNKKADAVPASGVQSGSLPATVTNTAPLIGSAAQLTNGLFNATIYVNSNRVVSASESNAMFTTNLVFYLDSTSSNLLFTFPSPPASANVSFSIVNGGTNSVTLTNTAGNTFKVAAGYFSAFSNAITLGGYFDKGQTWINLNSTNWIMVQHSRTLQDLQDVARVATAITNGNLIVATNLPASSVNAGNLGATTTNTAPIATANINFGYGLTNSGGALVFDTNYVNNTVDRELLVTEATTTTLPAYNYNNANGTITGLSVGGLTIDGQTVAVGDTILVKNETTAATNGIYTCTQVSGILVYILQRASYFNAASNILAGDTVFVQKGTVNTNTTWELLNTGTITIGTTPLNFLQTGFNTPLGTAAFSNAATMNIGGSSATSTTATNDSAGRNISTLSRTNEPNSVTFTNAGNLISFNQSVLLTQANTNLVIDGTGYPNHMMFSVTCTNNLFVRLTNWATDSEIMLKVFQGTGLTNAISYLTNASTTSPFTRAPFFYTLPTNTANSVLVNKWIFTTTTNSDLMGQVPIQ